MEKYFSEPKQKRIYDIIVRFRSTNGFYPSYREIQKLAGLSSVSVIHYHISKLAERKFLEKKPNLKRNFTLLK